jgi:hypothetical protein
MKKVTVKQNKDNFNKREGEFLYDNKNDEILLNVLDLYPNKTSYFFQGEGGRLKKEALQQKVRETYNREQEDEVLYDAGGRGLKKFKKGLKKIGKGIATAALSPARTAALALIRLNFRASGKKMSLFNSQGEKKLFDKWEKLGGKKDSLKKAIEAGKGKKALVCGKKCRAKAGPNPQVPKDNEEFSNFDSSKYLYTVDPGTASLIATGAGVVSTLVGVANKDKDFKNQKELMQLQNDLSQKEREEAAIDATMTPQEKKIADEILKAQESGSDPIIAIQNNPNLTNDEKQEAISQIKGMQKSNIGIDTNKKIILGVVAIIGLVVLYKYYQSQKQQ